MVTKHLTDEEIQLFAIDKNSCEVSVTEHIHVCQECKTKVEVYQSLITGIKQQPIPSFSYDLSELVMKQLAMPQPKPTNDKLFTWIVVFICIGFASIIFYYFQSYLTSIFEGVTTIFIYMMAISAITVIALLVADMYKKFKKEMKILDLY